MKRQNTQVKLGELIVLSRGEYSDHGINGFYVALQDLDLSKLADTFTATHADKYGYCPADLFASWVVSQGVVLPVTYREIHTGAYGRLEF